MITHNLLMAAVVATVLGAGASPAAAQTGGAEPTASSTLRLPFLHGLFAGAADTRNELGSLAQADQWLNTTPLTGPALRGKVVLIDFWTYTCINWLRTLPYVRAWAEKYNDQGLVVIGVHTPEFSFEKDLDNVRRALRDREITYPVAIDNDQKIWRAFNNNYWPALYFVDAKGRLRHQYFGEGSYEQSEMIIQQLLSEAGRADFARDAVMVEGRGPEAPADWRNLMSPENYLGYARTDNFASPGGLLRDRLRAYQLPAMWRLNQWALSGDWTVTREAASLTNSVGRLAYRFHARDLHVVMGPSAPGRSVRFRVLIDGRPPGAAHGVDVNEEGEGIVSHQRLYQLIRQVTPIQDRLFEIEFLDPGVDAFAFTFG